MAPNVLIVGAGASRAEAIANNISNDDLPPLDNDFFDIAEGHATNHHLERVKRYLNNNYSIDIANGFKARMEESFGLIYSDTMIDPMPKGAKLAFSALCRIYAKVIANTTNGIDIKNDGPLATLIKRLLQINELVIITFNQDLIV